MAGTTGGLPRHLRLKIESHPANLASLRKAVEAFVRENGYGTQAVADVGLCVNEAIANVIRHAYGGAADRQVQLDVTAEADGLRIEIRDWGCGVAPQLGCDEKRDPYTPGGIGLLCLKKLMDEVRFEPQPDGMLLCMKRGRRP